MQTLASPPSSAVTTRKLTSIGHELELDENSFGWLEDSSSIRSDAAALQQRMDENGYLYIKGFFNRDIILEARQVLLTALEKDNDKTNFVPVCVSPHLTSPHLTHSRCA